MKFIFIFFNEFILKDLTSSTNPLSVIYELNNINFTVLKEVIFIIDVE